MLGARISIESLYGATCSDQPIKPISQVWARGLGQGIDIKIGKKLLLCFVFNPASPPASPEGEADGGQAASDI